MPKANSRLVTLFAGATLVALSSYPLFCQQKPNPITNLHDLELGMPRDMVLAGLVAAGYKLKEEIQPPPGPKDSDTWQVVSGNVDVCDLDFKEGKLEDAQITLYFGAGDAEVVNRLFDAIYDQSGESNIEEKAGELTRSRSAALVVESTELTFSIPCAPGASCREDKGFKWRTLKFVIGQRQFNLSVDTHAKDDRTVALQEIILKRWQAGSDQNEGQ